MKAKVSFFILFTRFLKNGTFFCHQVGQIKSYRALDQCVLKEVARSNFGEGYQAFLLKIKRTSSFFAIPLCRFCAKWQINLLLSVCLAKTQRLNCFQLGHVCTFTIEFKCLRMYFYTLLRRLHI